MEQIQLNQASQPTQADTQNLILSQCDVKRRFGWSRRRQWRLRKDGKLDYLDFGNGRIGYLPEHIEEYLRRCERKAITSTQTSSEHTAQLESDARSLYEKSRLKSHRWKNLRPPAICFQQRLPWVQIKEGRLYSIVMMMCDPADYVPPPHVFAEYSNAIRAHGIDKVRRSHWHGNSREIWVKSVPNAIADEIGFALFQIALAYRPQEVEKKPWLEAMLDAMLEGD